MRVPGCLAEHDFSHGCACFLSLAPASWYVAGAFYNPEAPAFMSPFESIEKWEGGEEVRNVAPDLVIAVLVVIILVLLALRFV
jgi:hypothetical protein